MWWSGRTQRPKFPTHLIGLGSSSGLPGWLEGSTTISQSELLRLWPDEAGLTTLRRHSDAVKWQKDFEPHWGPGSDETCVENPQLHNP